MIETAVPFYTEEAYKEILRLVPASESNNALPYAQFVEFVERCRSEAIKLGCLPIRINVEPRAVEEWCKAQGVSVCRKSIGMYAMANLANSRLRLDRN